MNEDTAVQSQSSRTEHLKPWQYKKGQSGNPSGRAKGISMKEYIKMKFNTMTEEEREEFINGLDKIDLFKMAEGNPESKTDITTAGKPIIQIASEIATKHEINPSPINDSQE